MMASRAKLFEPPASVGKRHIAPLVLASFLSSRNWTLKLYQERNGRLEAKAGEPIKSAKKGKMAWKSGRSAIGSLSLYISIPVIRNHARQHDIRLKGSYEA